MGAPLKGKFKPRNPKKYKGDPTNIIFRSSWERDVMGLLDTNPKVKWWQSEEKCFPYYNPVDKRTRMYFPDFIVCYDRNGIEQIEVIEVKPAKQVKGPNPNPKRRTKNWAKEVQTYLINQNKWKSMTEVCENKGWNFKILTEDNVSRWKR
tara:strand:+ start:788 stop:1237 length:450 start_codon:yes stop_codon:yes gene_type:complete